MKTLSCARIRVSGWVVQALAVLLAAAPGFSPRANAQEIDRNALDAFRQQVVAKMCADGGEWLRCYKTDPLRCQTVSTVLVDSCVASELTAKPAALRDPSQASAIAERLYSCLRTKFLAKYGADKLDTDECAGIDS